MTTHHPPAPAVPRPWAAVMAPALNRGYQVRRPGSDVQVIVEPAAGGTRVYETMPCLAVEDHDCGCRTLVLGHSAGGRVLLRLDNRPAEDRGRCTRTHHDGVPVVAP